MEEAPGQGQRLQRRMRCFPTRVYTILPSFRDNAFLPLLRNCGRIDVILPEWFEITGPSLAVSRLVVDAETKGVLHRSNRNGAEQVEFWPVFNLGETLTAEAFVQG